MKLTKGNIRDIIKEEVYRIINEESKLKGDIEVYHDQEYDEDLEYDNVKDMSTDQLNKLLGHIWNFVNDKNVKISDRAERNSELMKVTGAVAKARDDSKNSEEGTGTIELDEREEMEKLSYLLNSIQNSNDSDHSLIKKGEIVKISGMIPEGLYTFDRFIKRFGYEDI